MANDTTSAYEQDLMDVEVLVCPYDRLEDVTPTIHKPAAVLGTDGSLITGTIIEVHTDNSVITLSTKHGKKFYHQVRNVLTYAAAVEATWGTLNFGQAVYYDPSATMPAACKLSLSPLDNAGATNTLFGHIVWAQDEIPEPQRGDRDPYPLGSAVAGVTHTDICIRQLGG